MSASREKKTRQDITAQGPTDRQQKKQQEAAEARRSTILYTAVGAVCVVLFVFVVIWNLGFIQRSAAAVTINGVKYTAADVQYYYNSVLSGFGLSSTPDSMQNAIMEYAVDALLTDAAKADKAEAEGYAMSEEARESLDSQLALLDTIWQDYGYSSQKAFLQANYGPYMTYDKLTALLTRQALANDYSSAYVNSLEYSDADYQAYYQENADSLDSFTLTQFVFQAYLDTADDERTEEELTAAYEELKAEVKATAEELKARLEAGEDPEALIEAYKEDLYSYDVSKVTLGSSVNSAYTDWAYDTARQAGDTTLAEYESTTAYTYNYYVARFEGRELDTESITADVRHILVSPETDEGTDEATDEQIAAAKTQAEELLAQWEAGEATEDSFAALAVENSADTGSASNGGLISGITASSSYVDTFKDWALDPARKAGETGIVQSEYGWHIMYYVSGEPTWENTIRTALSTQDYNTWLEAALEGYEADTGLGIKFVQA